MQSIFLKETRGKETSACPGGGQQVAENGGNERAVPKKFVPGLKPRLRLFSPASFLLGPCSQLLCGKITSFDVGY